jgi:predicted transcriptional regulator
MVNSAGFVPLGDGAVPRTWTGKAGDVISGGVFVAGSSADNIVSSGVNSYAYGDIVYQPDASGGAVNGMALQTAESGASVSVVRRGDVICVANGAVTAGMPVSVDGNNAVADCGSVAGNLAHQRCIGRAQTGAASGGHCIVHLNL